jgi:TPR repeat protein
MYARGRGVPQDYQEAVNGIASRRHKEMPQPSTVWVLAYEKGRGVPQDYEQAVMWYRLAAAREDDWAQMRLGRSTRKARACRRIMRRR